MGEGVPDKRIEGAEASAGAINASEGAPAESGGASITSIPRPLEEQAYLAELHLSAKHNPGEFAMRGATAA